MFGQDDAQERIDRLERHIEYLYSALIRTGQLPPDAMTSRDRPVAGQGLGGGEAAAGAGGGIPGVSDAVVRLARAGKKIEAIKLYRELTRSDLRTAKQIIDGIR